VELSARPVLKLGATPATLSVPLKLGLSATDYYEGASGSDTFGYFDVGAIVSVPLGFFPQGAWDVHGGLDVLFLGDNLEAFNGGNAVQPVALIGVGLVLYPSLPARSLPCPPSHGRGTEPGWRRAQR
jgi:hypothetical protein